jgi:two-component system, NarL family, invasion response regulator UvrY
MAPCRILLVDDHAVVRAGCRLLLQRRAGTEIIEAGSAAEGVRLAAGHQPQLVVLDLGLGDGSGFDIMQRLRTDGPATRILVFTMHEDPVMAARALEAGAAGYASKNDEPDTFLDAVDTVLRGEIYLSPAMARKLALHQIRAGDNPLRSLSRRELEILRLFGAGESLAEIADALQLSYRTVANGVSVIKRKLNIATNARLLRLAIEHMPHGV